jgi:hypothetical protein
MTWVPDSTTPGYLGPRAAPSPQPLEDQDWDNFLHDMLSGITGLDATLVRPRWQPEPPNMPDFGTDWLGFGVVNVDLDFCPATIHVSTSTDEYEALQEHEIDTVLCSFYGPNCGRYASYLRRGLFLDQNRAIFRANAVGLVEITSFVAAPELVRERWFDRTDTNVILRREIRFDYSVRTITRAYGTIKANRPLGSRTVIDGHGFDTGFIP